MKTNQPIPAKVSQDGMNAKPVNPYAPMDGMTAIDPKSKFWEWAENYPERSLTQPMPPGSEIMVEGEIAYQIRFRHRNNYGQYKPWINIVKEEHDKRIALDFDHWQLRKCYIPNQQSEGEKEPNSLQEKISYMQSDNFTGWSEDAKNGYLTACATITEWDAKQQSATVQPQSASVETNSLTGEVWKDVIDYEGLYKISNFGRVLSLKRNINNRHTPEAILIGTVNSYGYKKVNFFREKNNVISVHRLVAKNFLTNPLKLTEVNHKDCDKLNNHVDNLEWCSREHNMNHAYRNKLIKRGPVKQVIDTSTNEIYPNIEAASKIVGIRGTSLSFMLRGIRKNWTTMVFFDPVVHNQPTQQSKDLQQVVELIEGIQCPDGYDKSTFTLTVHRILDLIKNKS